MQETIKEILLINIYWFSLPLIGYAILHYLSKQSKNLFGLREISQYVLKQHIFTIFLYSFATFFLINTLTAVICYLFNAPAKVFTIFYICSVLIATLYLLFQFLRNLFIFTVIDPFKLDKVDFFTKTVFLLLAVIIIGDFFLSLYVKAFFPASDAAFHISRIVDILASGFNVSSPHHSNLPEAAYHYNAVYSLYIPPSQIFDLPPFKVWEYSLSFFRLLQWAAIYTLAAYVVKHLLGVKKQVTLLASTLAILGIAVSAGYLFIANYPARVVDIWTILLLISISLYESRVKGIKHTIPIITFIIAFTHPTYSLMVLLFIVLFLIVKTILHRQLKLKENSIYLYSLLILATTPLISFLTPGELDANQWITSILSPNTITIIDQVVRRPFIYENGLSLIPIVLLGLSFIGYLYLLVTVHRQRSQLALVGSLILFFPLIAYIPFVYEILSKVLPPWMIERFSQMNILALMAAGIGVFAIAKLLIKTINATKLSKYLYVFSCVLIIILSAFVAHGSYAYLFVRGGWNQYGYELTENNYEQLRGIYNNGDSVLTIPERSLTVPGLFAVDVVAVGSGYSTKSADTANRLLCQEEVLKSLKYQDLKFLGVDYVELPLNADSKVSTEVPYLNKIGVVQDYTIFEFNKNYTLMASNGEVTRTCVEFVENEKKLHLFNQ